MSDNLISLWNIMELPPHTHTTVFRHHGMLSTFDFENFVGAASWSQVSFHWNVMCPWTPLDLPACKELLLDVLEVVLSQGGGDFANSHSSQFIWAGPYTIFRLIEYPTTCCSHTLSAAEWHTRFWCAYTSITMEHHLAARTNAFFTFLLPPARHVPWSTHWVLTGCSLDYSLDYSLTTHLTTHLLLTWLLTWYSLGAHWVLTGCSLTQLGSPAMMHLQSCTTVPNNEKHAFRCRGVSKNRCSRTPYGIQHMLWT